MPKVTIDGREIEVPAGTSVIAAAEQLGIEVPHYCYHPRLTVAGNCRMCLVEVEKFPKLQTSCTTPVAEGMVVHTTTPRVKEARGNVLEFLLLNHPLDCPICDKAGECSLQNLYFEHSKKDSRLDVDDKVHKPKNVDLGQHIVLDAERCILCTRCIRFMDEVAHDPVLGIIDRGDHSRLAIFPGKRLDSRYSINTTDICPVGALTSKEFRFRKRVWFLKHTKSVCPNCATGCPVILDHEGGKMYRMMPGQRDGVTTWLCDPGRLGFQFVHDEARPQVPTARSTVAGQGQTLLPWDEALSKVASGLKDLQAKHGEDAVGVVFSNWCTNEEVWAALTLARTLGTTMVAAHRPARGLVDSGPPDGVLIREDKNPNSRGATEIPALLKTTLKSLDEIWDAAEGGTLKALYVIDPDLLGRIADESARARAEAALAKLSLLVVQSPLAAATSKLAHVLLPSATWAEKEGSFTNVEGLVQKIRAAFPPRGQALADLEIFRRLSAALGPSLGVVTASDAFGRIVEQVPSFSGLQYRKLEKGYGRLHAPDSPASA